jgi:hypothetical protein
MDELQSHLRQEPPPGDDVVVVRGGEDNVESADLDLLLACFEPASHNPGYGRFHR